MTASPLNPKACSYHARSHSLPSRPHPIIPQFEENLWRLRSSAAASSSSSSSLINHKLSRLQDLHDCVDKFLALPLTQQALAQDCQENLVDELLDGSLRILDVCSTAKDALLHTKECTLDLQSILRRRQGGQILSAQVRKFLTSRKAMKRAIQKSMGNLKSVEKICSFSPSVNVVMLREAAEITLNVFESFLSFISAPKGGSKPSGWSLVSRLMHTKKVAFKEDQEMDANEFAELDAALYNLVSNKTRKFDQIVEVQNVQQQLEKLELCIQGLEQGFECLFRCLVKNRVSLLNILNH